MVVVKVNGIDTNIKKAETGFVISSNYNDVKTFAFEDIIGLEKKQNGTDCILHYIKGHQFPNHKLSKEVLSFTTDKKTFSDFQTEVKEKIQIETERPRKLALFVNPIGGKGKGKKICDQEVVPLLNLAGIQTDVIVSERAGHFKDLAKSYDFKSVDGLVIMGGDGTVSEIMNVLMRETQMKAGIDFNDSNREIKTTEFPIGVIPTGSACGVVKLAHGVNDVITSTLHIIRGKKGVYNTIGCFNNNKLLGYGVICYGYAMYADLLYDTDIHFRWLRTLRYVFVPLWHLLLKSRRTVNIEITYEYLNGSEPNDLCESETTSLKVTRNKSIINVVGTAHDLDFQDRPYDQQPELRNQFQCLDYLQCGRLELIKHFAHLYHLSIEHLESVKKFVTFSQVKSLHIRATENNPPEDRDLNLRFNIDGETHIMETPEVYIKQVPRSFTAFTSYKGSRHW